MQKEKFIFNCRSIRMIRKYIIAYWKSLLVMLVILYLTFAPSSTFDGVPRFRHADKVVHFVMFLGWSAVLVYDFLKQNQSIGFRKLEFILVVFVFPVLMGGLIEIMQGLFFARSADWLDWLADVCGVLAGSLLSCFVFKVRLRTEE